MVNDSVYISCVERAEAAEDRLATALAIVDAAAVECGLPQDPCFALALLNEDEQRRLYALLKGEG